MMLTVADVSSRRCPYKDRLDHCTAKFGCRNQRKPDEPGGLRRLRRRRPARLSERLGDHVSSDGPDAAIGEVRSGRDAPGARGRPDDVRLRRRPGHPDASVVPAFRALSRMRRRGRGGRRRAVAPTEPESFLRPPFRLACQAVIEATSRHRVPPAQASAAHRHGQTTSSTETRGSVAKPSRPRRPPTALDPAGPLGLAIDVGTTTVVVELVELGQRQSRRRRRVREPAGLRRQRRHEPDLVRRASSRVSCDTR